MKSLTYKIKTKPFIFRAVKLFISGDEFDKTPVAFGKRIYMPKVPLPEKEYGAGIEHEEVHLRQQGNSYVGAIIWWFKYLKDKEFRYRQEIPAYRAHIEILVADKVMGRAQLVHRAAKFLSGPEYGKLATYKQAKWDLKFGMGVTATKLIGRFLGFEKYPYPLLKEKALEKTREKIEEQILREYSEL